jgi:hypothetical protein
MDEFDTFAEKVAQEPKPVIVHAPGQIIKKVLFTRTEITIYPNGDTWQKSSSWFEKGSQIVKKKEKKPKKQAEQSTISQPEEW